MNYAYDHYQHNINYGKAVIAIINSYINPNVALTIAPNNGPQSNDQLNLLVKEYFKTLHGFLIGSRWSRPNNHHLLTKGINFNEKQKINGHTHIIAEFHHSFISTPRDQVKLMRLSRDACKIVYPRSSIKVGSKVKLKNKKFSFEGLEPSVKVQLLYDADGWSNYIIKTAYHNDFKRSYNLF